MLYQPNDEPTQSTGAMAMLTAIGSLSCFRFKRPRVLLMPTCTFVPTMGSCLDSPITWSEEASSRRLYEGKLERIWYLTLMFIAFLAVSGLFSVALSVWTMCRNFCRRERAMRIEVAENFAIEDRHAERAPQFQSIVIGAVSVEQEDNNAGSSPTDDMQGQETDESSARGEGSLAYCGATVTDDALSSASCFGI